MTAPAEAPPGPIGQGYTTARAGKGDAPRSRWASAGRWWRDRPLWMLFPATAALLIIVLVPTAITIWLAFLNVNVHTLHEWLGAPFYGLQNFVNAFTQPSTLGVTLGWSIFVSFAFSILTTVVITPIGMLAAFSVHRRFRGRGIVRAIYLIPYTIPTFVVALTARVVFLNGSGLVDKIFGGIGLISGNTYWLIGPHAYWALQLTEIWATWPFIYLMTLAGLQAIPKEHYEASALDGATKAQRVRHVIIPELSGVLKLAMLLSTLFHFGNFTLVFVMFGNPPPPGVEVLPISAYYNAFSFFNFGVAAAIAVVTIVILMVPAYVYMRSTRLTGGLN